MDLVGNSTAVVDKLKFLGKPVDRHAEMLAYLRRTPQVRDVVVSGGDVANMPWPRLEEFLTRLLEIDNIRDIRLATKALMGLPQHWLQDEVRAGVERVARIARDRGVSLAIHTHVNHANSVTPLVADASKAMLEAGVRDVRNQGVLLDGVNADPHTLLDLCFALLDGAQIMPYYFYMCDMIPFSEHWRVSVADAQRLQHHMMGYLPGFATPRIVCDVPFVGKRWVHQLADYDQEHGISYWTKNYRTSIEASDPEALTRTYAYYDPIHTLPESGQAWWRRHALDTDLADAERAAAESRSAAHQQAESQKLTRPSDPGRVTASTVTRCTSTRSSTTVRTRVTPPVNGRGEGLHEAGDRAVEAPLLRERDQRVGVHRGERQRQVGSAEVDVAGHPGDGAGHLEVVGRGEDLAARARRDVGVRVLRGRLQPGDVPEALQQRHRGLLADPVDAGQPVGRVAAQGREVGVLPAVDAVLLAYDGVGDPLVLADAAGDVEDPHVGVVVDELEEVAVPGDDVDRHPGVLGQRADHVVGLVAVGARPP